MKDRNAGSDWDKSEATRNWRSERDADAADRDVPVDEYPGSDELAWLNKEFRG